MQSELYYKCKVNFAYVSIQIEWSTKVKNRIKELRKEHKLSQGELADLVGTTRQTITSIEVGKYTASLPLAYKIAKQFSLSIEEVFDFSEEEA